MPPSAATVATLRAVGATSPSLRCRHHQRAAMLPANVASSVPYSLPNRHASGVLRTRPPVASEAALATAAAIQ